MGKNLDAELAEAAGVDASAASENTSPAAAVPTGKDRPSEPRTTNFVLLFALLLLMGGLVSLFIFGFKDAAIYSVPVSDLKRRADELGERRVRIDGELVPGSLRKRDKPCEYRFGLRDGDQQVQVRFPQCVVPDGFRDMPEGGVLVTVEGSLTPEGYFEAASIMAKCSSKYDPETHQMRDEAP
jgi:cytochrome c-type biogenesis protein CcmE